MTRKSLRCRPIGVALAGALVLLSACGHMPVTSMVKLARTDFATVDPAELRVAVKLPQTVRPRRDGVRLRVTVKTGSGPAQVEEFVLRDLNDAGELMALRAEVEPGTAIYAFRLDPNDLARVQAFRAAALQRQASGARARSRSASAPRPAALPPSRMGRFISPRISRRRRRGITSH